MPRSRICVELFLDNPLHRRIMEMLRKEHEDGGEGAAQAVESTPPHSPTEIAAASLPDTDANVELNRQLAQLVNRIHNTDVGDRFLIPVIGRMNAGQWYDLDELTAMTNGRYNRRQTHSLVARAGAIEKDGNGVIFERRKDETSGRQKYRIAAELQQAILSRAA
ncbi:MAG: hypothetical protein ACKVP0_01870 [Pirellulaceae bacterium]